MPIILFIVTLGFGFIVLYYFTAFFIGHYTRIEVQTVHLKLLMVILFLVTSTFSLKSNTEFSSNFNVTGSWYPAEDVQTFDAPMATKAPTESKSLDNTKSNVSDNFNNAIKKLQEENEK